MSVAVVGCGVGGSICAALLKASGRHVRVFAGAVGGRSAAEKHGKSESALQFDSGTQFFHTSDPRVRGLMSHSLFEG